MRIAVSHLPHANIDPVDEQGTYILVDNYVFVLTINDILHRFEIDAGFSHDGASVPRLARWLIERDGVHRESALVHDYMYVKNGHIDLGDAFLSYTRKDADKVFRACLKYQRLASWKVALMYAAVRIGGRFYRQF